MQSYLFSGKKTRDEKSYNVFDIVCSVSWKYASAHRQNEKWLNSRHRLCLGEPCGMIPIRFLRIDRIFAI